MATLSHDKPTGEVKAQDVFGARRAHYTIASRVNTVVSLHLVYDRGVAVND